MRAPLTAAVLAALLTGCAHAPAEDPRDPLEPVNRAVFSFNMQLDRYVARPVAEAYVDTVPSVARTGIRNFFQNLFYPTVIVNDVLQLKIARGVQDLARFLLNSTFGLAGFFDVATPAGMPANDEDFGQTLGRWGMGEGWFLMLPVLGPSSNRDLLGSVADGYTSPLFYLGEEETGVEGLGLALGLLDAVDDRAALLGTERLLERQLDPYIFVRTVYLQRRHNLVYDGNPPPEDYGFEDDFEDTE